MVAAAATAPLRAPLQLAPAARLPHLLHLLALPSAGAACLTAPPPGMAACRDIKAGTELTYDYKYKVRCAGAGRAGHSLSPCTAWHVQQQAGWVAWLQWRTGCADAAAPHGAACLQVGMAKDKEIACRCGTAKCRGRLL